MSTSDTIIYGVVAGISTSFIIFLIVQIFNKIIVPWYKSTVYRGLSINGFWIAEQDHPTALDIYKLEIRQKGQILKGLLTVVKHDKNTSGTEVKNFVLKGEFHDGHIILSGNNANLKYRGHVTYLLKVSYGGKKLVGVTSWVDSGSDNINAIHSMFIRDDS